jgi:alkylated DNA repair dioxygenase AlkB
MENLFPAEVGAEDVPRIPGLAYLRNYIAEQEEAELASAIDALAWNTSWQRRRQLYGASYGKPEGVPQSIPPWGCSLAERIFADGLSERPFDQMLVNEYLSGQGITLHRDYETFDKTVVSLSLLSLCVMDFRHVGDERRESLLLERRSLLILSGPARYEWQHGIAARKNDVWHEMKYSRARRLSITFRSVK